MDVAVDVDTLKDEDTKVSTLQKLNFTTLHVQC